MGSFYTLWLVTTSWFGYSGVSFSLLKEIAWLHNSIWNYLFVHFQINHFEGEAKGWRAKFLKESDGYSITSPLVLLAILISFGNFLHLPKDSLWHWVFKIQVAKSLHLNIYISWNLKDDSPSYVSILQNYLKNLKGWLQEFQKKCWQHRLLNPIPTF